MKMKLQFAAIIFALHVCASAHVFTSPESSGRLKHFIGAVKKQDHPGESDQLNQRIFGLWPAASASAFATGNSNCDSFFSHFLPTVLDTSVQRIVDADVIADQSLLYRLVYSESLQNSGCRNLSDRSLVVDPQHVAFAPVFKVALEGGVKHVGLKTVKDGQRLGAWLLDGITKRSWDVGNGNWRGGVDHDFGLEFFRLSRNVVSGDSRSGIEDESFIFDGHPSHYRSGWSGSSLGVLHPLVRRSIAWIQPRVIPQVVNQSNAHCHSKPKWERVLTLGLSVRGGQSATILTCAPEYVKKEIAE